MSMNALWEEVAVVLDVKINMEVLLAVVPMVLSEQEMDIASEEDLDSNREFPATVDSVVLVVTHLKLTPCATSVCQVVTQTEDKRGQLMKADFCTLMIKKWAIST